MDSEQQRSAAQQRLSALMDGELDAGAAHGACAEWRNDPRSRADWHTYHLIGDVLRSDDLACDPGHDAAFLAAFRARLATEPVVLAPRALDSGSRVAGATAVRRWSWVAPSAVAAGFVAVAATLVLTRGPGAAPERDAGASLARATSAAAPQMIGASALAGEPQVVIANGQLIRDARLDRYLDAHQQFAGSSALGVPSAFLRSATTASPSGR